MTAIEKLITYLTSRFNKSNEIFKAIVGDDSTAPVSPIVTSADYNQGAIANELEWQSSMIKQMRDSANINNLTELEVPFWESLVGLSQATHETVMQFVDRVLSIMAGEKQTPYGITQSMLRYSDSVSINEMYTEGAFADVTFADYYKGSLAPVVTSAYASSSNMAFNVLRIIILLEYNTRLGNPAVRRTVIGILREIVLPGVIYSIELTY